ncbi:MAG TPA: DUF1348 family protein [Rhizomicrobium sp.]|nr:DUF1348 family protein [Rhizomicrobium sp.]
MEQPRPARVAQAYTSDSQWRNRAECTDDDRDEQPAISVIHSSFCVL